MKTLELFCKYEDKKTSHVLNGRMIDSKDYGFLKPEIKERFKDKYVVTCNSCRNTYVVEGGDLI